jgi:hypothetical protein
MSSERVGQHADSRVLGYRKAHAPTKEGTQRREGLPRNLLIASTVR